MALYLVQGWTQRIIYQLKQDGAPMPLTGLTVDMLLYDATGKPVVFAGTADVLDEPTGKVYFDPAPADLVKLKSPYSVRWRITNGPNVTFFPNSAPEQWTVAFP